MTTPSKAPLLPPNATQLMHSLAKACDGVLNSIELRARDLWNPDLCPEEYLPFLAWSFALDNWNPDWPVHTKRAVIKVAIATQRIKGTPKAVKDVVESYGGTIAIREPYEEGGSGVPHLFDVVITDGGIADSNVQQADLLRGINNTKPERSQINLSVASAAQDTLYVTGGAKPVAMHRFDGIMEAAA